MTVYTLAEEEPENEVKNNSEVEHLKSQILTLTKSMSTFSEEKTKIVNAYQSEKRNLKVD